MTTKPDYRDIFGGATLVALGLFISIYASANYAIGTPGRMGPGMLPVALGIVLAGLGVAVLVPALFRTGAVERPDYRSLAAVLGGMLAFALAIDTLGVVPAIFLLIIGAVLADNSIGIVGSIVLATALSILSILIFHVGLGLSLRMFAWPF